MKDYSKWLTCINSFNPNKALWCMHIYYFRLTNGKRNTKILVKFLMINSYGFSSVETVLKQKVTFFLNLSAKPHLTCTDFVAKLGLKWDQAIIIIFYSRLIFIYFAAAIFVFHFWILFQTLLGLGDVCVIFVYYFPNSSLTAMLIWYLETHLPLKPFLIFFFFFCAQRCFY